MWLFTVILIDLAIFPVSQHLQTGAEFPDNSFKGRICQEKSLVSFLGSENNTFIENLRQRFLTLVGNAIAIIYSLSFAFRIKTFVNKRCLLKCSFSAVGGNYRRNILTFREEFLVFLSFVVFNCVDSISIFIFSYLQNTFSPRTVFLLNNLSWLFFIDMLQNFVVPLYILKSRLKENYFVSLKEKPKRKSVNIEMQILEPRRDA